MKSKKVLIDGRNRAMIFCKRALFPQFFDVNMKNEKILTDERFG